MAGRKSKPTSIKKAQGTLQKCRTPEKEMEVERVIKIPYPPKWFSPIGKKIYQTTAKELAANNLLQTVGLPLLISFSNQMALHLETEEQLRTKSRVQALRNDTGQIKSLIVNPYHKISQDALNSAIKLASEFGLTPSAQSRIVAPFVKGKNDEDKDFD